ncbi:Hint domain-containing protein [Cognatishimia activa]|uniref:Hint domain-containing protein n=1 Tax=Cognatishimia activa TaxID=1715691 RepID=UPI0022304615|nr:Hint domain-containing protein [Cognatishimia activa]UZD91919.1 Hint domain-containing protein [Cognatishimia activa]
MPTNSTIDWSAISENGDFTLGSGTSEIGVSIETTTNGDGQTGAIGDQGMPTANGLWVNGLTDAVTTTLTFDQPVQDLSFELFDVDQNGTDWDERVTILATDAEGNVYPVSFNDLAATHSASGATIDTSGSNDLTTDTTGAADSISVSIAGPITSLEIIFEPGESANETGAIGLSDITLIHALDGVVEGTATADLIDGLYLNDPEGDMVTSGDDVIEAGDGNDTINSGEGNDIVYGGDGADLSELGFGNDQFFGGEGDDSVNGDRGNDELHGGTGNDFLRGSFGNDTIHSGGAGEGDDYLWGGYGDDTFVIQNGFGNDTIDAENEEETLGDTLDLSNVTEDLTIDLTNGLQGQGSFSNGTDTATFDAIEHIQLSAGQDTLVLADGSGSDTVSGFSSPIDNGDGTFTGQDMLDVTSLTSDFGATTVTTRDVTVTEDADGNAVLTFPGGENLTLQGVPASAFDDPLALEAIGIPAAPDGYFSGTDNDDVLIVGATDADGDVIDGGDAALPGASGDDDHILAMGGNDLVFAGAGNDIVEAGDGNDTVFASIGDDTLYAGSGNNELYGEDGDDVFHSGAGANHMHGGIGDDTFFGITDGDDISGGDGIDTVNMSGLGPYNVVHSGSDPQAGTIEFLDGDGNVTGSASFKGIEKIVPCFTPGTQIATIRGLVDVADLEIGDLVCTRDHGMQEIRWIGKRALSEDELTRLPHLRGITIQKDALGENMPDRDMTVSPNHRVLVSDPKVELCFGEREVLVSAKHLLGFSGVSKSDATTQTYIHVLFDRHEIVLSDQLWSESFQPGEQALEGLDIAQREEIYELFPELQIRPSEVFQTARRVAQKHEAAILYK